MRKADEHYVRFMIEDGTEDFAKTLGLQYHPISQRTIGKMDSKDFLIYQTLMEQANDQL